MPHRGFQVTSVHSFDEAVQRIITLLYQELPSAKPHYFKNTKQTSRNEELCKRYTAGESVPALARAYGISEQRVHQILQGKRN
jgi:Mor family transcriptional regulator